MSHTPGLAAPHDRPTSSTLPEPTMDPNASNTDTLVNAQTDQPHIVELEPLQPTVNTGSPVLPPRLELFAGVKTQVIAVVGNAEAPIGQLLNLAPGDVLELDRRVDALVDLCVDAQVVARGQLCVVGDQFAIRIVEVPHA